MELLVKIFSIAVQMGVSNKKQQRKYRKRIISVLEGNELGSYQNNEMGSAGRQVGRYTYDFFFKLSFLLMLCVCNIVLCS